MANASTSITISFSGSADPVNVVLTIKDYSTEAVIAGASVSISGPNSFVFTGTSDALGKVEVGMCDPGTYTVLTTATGYQDSDLDFLANDTFTV